MTNISRGSYIYQMNELFWGVLIGNYWWDCDMGRCKYFTVSVTSALSLIYAPIAVGLALYAPIGFNDSWLITLRSVSGWHEGLFGFIPALLWILTCLAAVLFALWWFGVLIKKVCQKALGKYPSLEKLTELKLPRMCDEISFKE